MLETKRPNPQTQQNPSEVDSSQGVLFQRTTVPEGADKALLLCEKL